MDFENHEAFIFPFSVQETSAWKSVIQYLSKIDSTPVDAICNSHIVSISKEYYPIERLEITYTAKWNAISVFKEYWTEQETHYGHEVHYFDRWGREHESPGFDYFDTKSGKWKSGTFNPIASSIKGYSGDRNSRPWEPREVTVTFTENIPCERETGRQNNSGNVKGNYIYHHSTGYPFFQTLFSDLTQNADIPYSEKSVKEATVMKHPNPFSENDYNSALSDAESEAKNRCIRQIPGQAYANFHMEFDSNGVCQIWYYPVYHIIYEYNKQKSECFVSGCQEGYVYGKDEPTDSSILTIMNQCDDYSSNLKNQKKKCWLKFVWIWLGACAAGTFVIPLIGLLLLKFPYVSAIIVLVLQIALVGSVIYLCWKNYKDIKNIKKEIEENDKTKDNIIPIRQAKKNAIKDIILNDNLSDSEKKAKCEAILKNSTNFK